MSLALTLCLPPYGPGFTASAQGGSPAERGETFGATYSRWSGRCSTNKIADVSCAMRLEAHSASGELLGFIVFGQGERSRFLAIGTRSMANASAVIKIDSVPIANVTCRNRSEFCSAVLSVDDELLARLLN